MMPIRIKNTWLLAKRKTLQQVSAMKKEIKELIAENDELKSLS